MIGSRFVGGKSVFLKHALNSTFTVLAKRAKTLIGTMIGGTSAQTRKKPMVTVSVFRFVYGTLLSFCIYVFVMFATRWFVVTVQQM